MTYRILALDAGGIKDSFAAGVLAALPKNTGQSLRLDGRGFDRRDHRALVGAGPVRASSPALAVPVEAVHFLCQRREDILRIGTTGTAFNISEKHLSGILGCNPGLVVILVKAQRQAANAQRCCWSIAGSTASTIKPRAVNSRSATHVRSRSNG